MYKLKYIITIENSESLKWESICLDFEYGLIRAITIVFKNIRVVGCMFHYIKNIRLQAVKHGLYSIEKSENIESMIKELGAAPFLFYNNSHIIEDIFDKYEHIFSNNNIILFNKYKNYFISTWLSYFNDGILNYIFINKVQRCNSYIENYNHRIREILIPFTNKIGISVIPWPVFLTFIKEEESFYKNLLTKLDNSNIQKKTLEEKFRHKLNIETND